ncbi:enoyl-CoA hydratase/isomerase family protein [Millisia brevis]|uniref:enoyl-CoA hydratase/isomerase family protein n=1 Tax=Millisia brevis TaxID=264148 RepID=UPI0008330FC8|nr:enoyl-CoA hydratase/isomerase family protein [Millisia brevis]
MSAGQAATDLRITRDGTVAQIEIVRPPHNYFDAVLLADLERTLRALADDGLTRAVVLCASGRNFCAGADFSSPLTLQHPATGRHLYEIAADLFDTELPIVAALHGAAIGGGLGLAMVADERVAADDVRLSPNFTRLGFHPGFGLSVTLADAIGRRRAAVLLGTGCEVRAAQAEQWGLVDEVIDATGVRAAAHRRARAWAVAAPLAVRSVRATTRADLVAAVRAVLPRELTEQQRLVATADWAEGIAAARERREPVFEGR